MAVEKSPRVASDYLPEASLLVRQTCLDVSTRLGDFSEDMCVVGGLVPSLLIDQADRDKESNHEHHIGTVDLDLGLSIVILDDCRYEEIARRLSEAGFNPDRNARGNPTSQRWRSSEGVTVDFLIPPGNEDTDRGGTLRNLEDHFAATITPGLDLAFQDFERVKIRGTLPAGGHAEREIQVCGPGAYVVLKSLAFANRGKPKDAYDLFYVVRNYPARAEYIARKIRDFGDREEVGKSLSILSRDFNDLDAVGPVRVAEFLGGPDDALQADVTGFIRELLNLLR